MATDTEPHRHPERLGIQLTKKRKLGFECRLLGAERKSILGDWMSACSQVRTLGVGTATSVLAAEMLGITAGWRV